MIKAKAKDPANANQEWISKDTESAIEFKARMRGSGSDPDEYDFDEDQVEDNIFTLSKADSLKENLKKVLGWYDE